MILFRVIVFRFVRWQNKIQFTNKIGLKQDIHVIIQSKTVLSSRFLFEKFGN